MSNPENFIDEVTEELRRDRLFALMRRYGWIAILLVLLIVGGAAYNEWQKATARAQAQALGDALGAALDEADPAAQIAAFQAIQADGDARALVAFLAIDGAGQADNSAALDDLRAIMQDTTILPLYRDLATLKLVSAGQLPADERVALLEPLTNAGAPFRALAEEQIALAEVEKGDKEAAISRLQVLLQDDDASQDLRGRIAQLIIALGATPDV